MMKTLPYPPNADPAAARIGLDAALTAAVACAQLLNLAEVTDRLVILKRDIIRCRQREADASLMPHTAFGDSPAGLHIN
jgi:hypothetical protein